MNNYNVMRGPDISKILHFLSICILAFINEGTSTLSCAFTEEPWSWGLSVPVSLYLKFALELHSHLGICVGIGLPSLVYWGATRNSIDWYWDAVLKFNVEIMKTGMCNLIIGLLHLLVSKLVHYIIEWVHDHKLKKRLSSSPLPCSCILTSMITKFESSAFCEYALLLSSVSVKNIIFKLIELIIIFFYNGNILLLSWCFSGQLYSYEVGKAISWVSMGSSMFVWIKALLKLFHVESMEENDPNFAIQSMEEESKGQSTCSPEC
ncbi:hypothetical protein PIB30_037630 [Stylosanthes scabra]|uniref:Uncharacterized protein n=1 Tax=Stylosanthes scabra TaxID=79078 RepID=A0ABU6QEJ8_9FABA|nr:hypothetical protein [Stylosanthes scabra]